MQNNNGAPSPHHLDSTNTIDYQWGSAFRHVFQDRICQLFKDLEMLWAYIDDLLVVSTGTTGTLEEHINDLDIVKNYF